MSQQQTPPENKDALYLELLSILKYALVGFLPLLLGYFRSKSKTAEHQTELAKTEIKIKEKALEQATDVSSSDDIIDRVIGRTGTGNKGDGK